jgi:hypothetical protein
MRADQKRFYGIYSRLRFVEYVVDEETKRARLGLRDKTFINTIKENNIPYVKYVIPAEYEYRPDLIANDVYGIVELWWVIYEYNEFTHPFNDFYAGRQILMPNKADLEAYLV